MTTQENWSDPRPEEQTLIDINGKEVWIDNELIPLIKALNDMGLITRTHCGGHEHKNAWIAIRLDNVKNVELRMDEPYSEILISWDRK